MRAIIMKIPTVARGQAKKRYCAFFLSGLAPVFFSSFAALAQTDAPPSQRETATPATNLNPTYYACMIGVDAYQLHAYKCAWGVPGDGTWQATFKCVAPGRDPRVEFPKSICNIHTPNGDQSVPHDPVPMLSDVHGGECGVSTWKITCHYRPGTDIFMILDRRVISVWDAVRTPMSLRGMSAQD